MEPFVLKIKKKKKTFYVTILIWHHLRKNIYIFLIQDKNSTLS